MPLKPGQPAKAADVWMRVLTNLQHVKKDGKIHNKAFGGKAIAPPTEQKPWSLELSGRLLSLTEDVEKESAAFCVPPLRYAGVMYQYVRTIRNDGTSENPPFLVDVIYTPQSGDQAHADVVTYGPTVEDRYVLRDWLQELVLYAAPGKCDVIEQLRSTETSA
jgi:hypothetical protein